MKMKELFWKFIGLPVTDLNEVVQWKFRFQDHSFSILVILAVIGFAIGTFLIYWKSPIQLSTGRKIILTGLRICFLVLVFLMLLQPAVILTIEGQLKGNLFVMMDASSSMSVKDARFTEDDRKRSALAQNFIPAKKGLNQVYKRSKNEETDLDRLDLSRKMLANDKLELMPRLEKKFNLSPMAFSDKLIELSVSETNRTGILGGKSSVSTAYDALQAAGERTAIGDALNELLDRKKGQTLSGVVLITDGGNNHGMPPLEVAARYRENGTPLYIYGVGITSPRDVSVSHLQAPELGFVKDELMISVTAKGQSLNNQKAVIELLLGKTKVAQKEIVFTDDKEQVVRIPFTPASPGDFPLIARIQPRPDESNKENNETAQRIKILDSKIKVLLIEETPRWEYRYLQSMLLRDRRIELKCLLIEADKAITRVPNSPYLEKFPVNKEDLFKYDLILLGDVSPTQFSRPQLENIQDFVSRFGGALIMLAGPRHNPWAFKGTPVEKLLPVEFEGNVPVPPANMNRPIRFELTPAGKISQMLSVEEPSDKNKTAWEQLPPIYWDAKVGRAKPAAEVLIVDSDPLKATSFGKMPILAMQQFGLGHVLFVGTDNTWRWRKNQGEKYHNTFWGQILQRMALQRLLGGAKRTQLSTDKKTYQPGERISIFARLYTAGYEPMVEENLSAELKGKNARAEILLRRMPEQPGVYRGEVLAPNPDHYSLNMTHDTQTKVEFDVVQPRYEAGEISMNEDLLKEMARLSGGAFFREEDLDKLPETVVNSGKKLRTQTAIDLTAAFPYYLLIIFLVGLEWFLRKRFYLK